MHRTAWNIRTGAKRLALSAACGLMMLAPSADAQFPLPGGSQDQSPQSVGTVLTVPLWDFGTIAAQNAIHQKNVSLLQVSQTAVGDLNSQIATVSIRQRNRQDPTQWDPATTCWLPVHSLNWVTQANKDSTIIEQNVVGFGNQQVAQVEVSQANDAVAAPGTHFVLAPLWGVPAIQALNQKNVNVVHVAQLAMGDNNSQVALLSVDQQNAAHTLQVPAGLTVPLLQLNLNLNIITQVAVGNGNTQVATVDVGQSNSVSGP